MKKIIAILSLLSISSAAFANIETPVCNQQLVNSLASVVGDKALEGLQTLNRDIVNYDNFSNSKAPTAGQSAVDAWQSVRIDYSALSVIDSVNAAAIDKACALGL